MSAALLLSIVWAGMVAAAAVLVVRGSRPARNSRGGRLGRWLSVSRSFFS